jgi:hypothetical protein
MPLREFPDSFGRVWQAWDTYPQGADSAGKGESAFSKYMANRPAQGGTRPTTAPQHGKQHDPVAEATTGPKLRKSGRRDLNPLPAEPHSDAHRSVAGWHTLGTKTSPGRGTGFPACEQLPTF